MMRDEALLCCEVGARRYMFRNGDVHHVERAEHVRADATADGRVGVLKLRDQAVPVFSLGDVLGQRRHSSATIADGHVAVTGTRDLLVGWLVDRLVRSDQPATEHVAPLPAIVGRPATAWFDGMVRLDDGSSALLIAPLCLNPLAAAAPQDRDACFPPAPWIAAPPEPVAVVFSTSVLPPSGARRYALSGRQIAAIVQPGATVPVPGCGEHVAGVIWWRDALVPVIDFRARADRLDTHRRRLIVQCGARHGGALVAFSIDAEVLMCRPEAGHRLRHDVACPPFASGVFDVNGEAVALIDLEVLLDGGRLRLGDGDAVLPDLLIQRAAGDAEPLGGPLDPPTLGL